MTDKQIREFIASGTLLRLECLMDGSAAFIRFFASYTSRYQEVGAVRRMDKWGRAIEVLMITPAKTVRRKLIASLDFHCENLDVSRADVWTATYYDHPAIIYFATKETFVVRQLLTTGPENYARLIQAKAKARGYTLDRDGFRKGDKIMVPFDEAEILETIGLPYIPPQKRANV